MLYHFEFELSDIDRGLYESLNFRIAQHPSETAPYLLTRALAYALSYQNDLEFSLGGLSDPDSPALQTTGSQGSIGLWIEIGNPSARKLHKASKAAKQVIIYTYKNTEPLLNEMKVSNIHRANEIQIYAFESGFLQILESQLEKNNRWSLLIQQGHLDVGFGNQSTSTEIRQFSLQNHS